MPSIFKNQGNVHLVIKTGIDLSTATVSQILYNKPNGTKGAFAASILGTTLVYDIQTGDLDTAGTWKLQAFAVISGNESYGSIANLHVHNNLK